VANCARTAGGIGAALRDSSDAGDGDQGFKDDPAVADDLLGENEAGLPKTLDAGDDLELVVEHGGLQVFGLYGTDDKYDMLFSGQGFLPEAGFAAAIPYGPVRRI
jgi:hypothetical protein